MTLWRYVIRALWQHRRIHAAVAISVAATTAVLTGALVVGDSVRASLRALTLDRLGQVDEVLATDRFFRRKLVDELSGSNGFKRFFRIASPAILFPSATIERSREGGTARAGQVFVMGCSDSFWDMGDKDGRPQTVPSSGQIVLNQPLADDLHASVGDEVVLRLPKSNQVPADSPLANKSDRLRSIGGLKVMEIIPARGLGQFGLRPRQTVPRNAYVALSTIQESLGIGEKINAILVGGTVRPGESDTADPDEASRELQESLRPSFDDYGFSLKHVRAAMPANGPKEARVAFDYYSLTTDRMVFAPEVERMLTAALDGMNAQPVFTYLSNKLVKADSDGAKAPESSVPYSMVSAIDPSDAFDLRDMQGARIGRPGEGEMILTDWAAKDLNVDVGDRVRMECFAPETTHGKAIERAAMFQVKAITPLTEPIEPFKRNRPAVYTSMPTLANDPDLTPTVKGVTDQDTIDDWDAPFPFDYTRVRKQDEAFWSNHRTTPKAYVSLESGWKLWGSRFGRVTSFRIPSALGVDEATIRQRVLSAISHEAASAGFAFSPVKRQQLKASQGTTPFDVLFLSLSFFIIAAALMLVALLFRLSVDQRAEELGTLLAIGMRRRRAGRLLLTEGAIVAAIGGLAGVGIGIAYAKLMLHGLQTWWIGAITSPFLHYHANVRSLVGGYFVGFMVCVVTIAWTVRGVRSIPVRRLLAGRMSSDDNFHRPGRWGTLFSMACAVAALILLIAAAGLAGMSQAGAFVGGGSLLLTGALSWLWTRLQCGGSASRDARRLQIAGLAWRNAARNPLRSTMSAGLIAVAVFLIVATSSFRLAPSERGVGGFEWIAESSEPVFADLNDPTERSELLADKADVLRGSTVFGLRLRGGDDASCNNLYQAVQPRVLGVTPDFISHFDKRQAESFVWSLTAARRPEDRANPWNLLTGDGSSIEDSIPAVVDMNTAFYSLKPPVMLGSIYEASYEPGRVVRFRIVGLLENSVLQGSLLISQRNFERLFPDVSGYRFFMIDAPRAESDAVARALEDRLGDEGFDAVPAHDVLAQLMQVQNAYLSTFQSLGALGLLLGTLGLAAVQWRNVVERRGELAVLRAMGYSHGRLLRLILLENVALLAVGLLIGGVAALAGVLPHKSFGAGAAIPPTLLRDVAFLIVAVFVVGVLSSLASVAAALRTPLLSALRDE